MIHPYLAVEYVLDLKKNAFDSINEALIKIEKADRGELREFKFAILHFTHFLELLLKFRIFNINEALIYKGVFSENLRKDRTITLAESTNFLLNCGLLHKGFAHDINKIKEIRNEVEHYSVKIDTHEVRLLIARLFNKSCDFFQSIDGESMEDFIERDKKSILEDLSNEMSIHTLEAEKKARETGINGAVSNCFSCGGMSTAAVLSGGRECYFCGVFDVKFNCFFCGKDWYRSNSLPLGKNASGTEELACEECAFGVTCGDEAKVAAYRTLPERYKIHLDNES